MGDRTANIFKSFAKRKKDPGPPTTGHAGEPEGNSEGRERSAGFRPSTHNSSDVPRSTASHNLRSEGSTQPQSQRTQSTSSSSGRAKSTGWGFLNSLGRRKTWWKGIKSINLMIHLVTGHQHVLALVLVVSIILQSLLLAGCAAEDVKIMYILSLSYNNITVAPQVPAQTSSNISSFIFNLAQNVTGIEVRIGYFGFCLIDGELGSAVCSPDVSTLATIVRDADISTDPLNLLSTAERFHDGTIFSGLIFISIVFALFAISLLLTFPAWHTEENSEGSDREVKPFPSRPITSIALACMLIATLFAFLSAFWQHLSAGATVSMVDAFTYGTVSAHVGAAAMAFGWLGAGLLALATLALWAMIVSIKALSAMVDEPKPPKRSPKPPPPLSRPWASGAMPPPGPRPPAWARGPPGMPPPGPRPPTWASGPTGMPPTKPTGWK